MFLADLMAAVLEVWRKFLRRDIGPLISLGIFPARNPLIFVRRLLCEGPKTHVMYVRNMGRAWALASSSSLPPFWILQPRY
jgi:hypothetical protein